MDWPSYEFIEIVIPFLIVDSKASRFAMKNTDIANMAKNNTNIPAA